MTDSKNQGIELTPRRILVTGGAGFIGSNFVHHWCCSYPGDRVVVLDALTYAGNKQTLASLEGGENFRFVQGNICDRALVDSLLQSENINTVAHFAAESHVDRSILGPEAFVQTNVIGTFTLLEAFLCTFPPTKFTVVSAPTIQPLQKRHLMLPTVPTQLQKLAVTTSPAPISTPTASPQLSPIALTITAPITSQKS